ncbi:MAG: NAD-dependent succinate-semialdehyde dehydrogenase, partial [Bradymonadaceae bacterium]
MRAINPKNGETIANYPDDTDTDIEESLVRAQNDFQEWSRTSFDERADLMTNAADRLREDIEAHARRMTDEMGKPLEEARGEVEKCAWVCEYFAEQAEEFLEPTEIETDASSSYVRYDPLGPILAIMPWNFPYWQVFRFAAPNLMAGNVGLLSHAANVPGCGEAIADIFEEAGFPSGAFQNLAIDDEQTQELIGDERVRGVTLTGSVRAGSAVAAAAGSAIKPTVLELGGSDPFIVLEDAHLGYTVEQAVRARTLNSGQSCIAAKRFIVEDGIHDEFVEAFEAKLADLEVGDPARKSTDIGPMAREDLRESLHRQVTETLEAGAALRLGGDVPEGPGYFYPVTLLTDVDAQMPAFTDETFGPVAAVTRASDSSHAIELANNSDYGLGASIWTRTGRGEDHVTDLEAGCVA